LSSLALQHLEQSKKSFCFRIRVVMAKNRNKKRNGLAAMDVSTDQTVMDAQAIDTSESVALQWCERKRGDFGPFFARMRAMLVLFFCQNGRRHGVCRYAEEDAKGSLQISTSFTPETGEGESICDFTGKNGNDAGDGFLLW
ncbi:hypothetical protein H5410_034011, partial [Solanum commersonii]